MAIQKSDAPNLRVRFTSTDWYEVVIPRPRSRAPVGVDGALLPLEDIKDDYVIGYIIDHDLETLAFLDGDGSLELRVQEPTSESVSICPSYAEEKPRGTVHHPTLDEDAELLNVIEIFVALRIQPGDFSAVLGLQEIARNVLAHAKGK